MKTIKFSVRYRPRFGEALARGAKITTTRLFDDKGFNVGDELSIVEKESGESLATGVISDISVSTFDTAFGSVDDLANTRAMYEEYYGRAILPDTETKELTIRLT